MFIPLTPIRCLYRGFDLYGHKIGVVSGSSRFTYGEFGERCERLAAGLLSEGAGPGDRIAFLSFNNHQLLEGYYAAPLARAIVMPLNVRLTPGELIQILNHSGARMLFFENDFAPYLPAFRASCPALERYVSIDGPAPEGGLGYEDLLARGRIARPDPMSFDENEIAEIFYTSGSTGAPKGVALSHRTIYLHALAITGSLNQRDSLVELHTIPLFHANGWGRPQSSTLNGIKQVMVRRFEPAYVLRLIEEERATGMLLVPVMANALLNCPKLGEFDTSSLQEIHLGGAASSPELIARLEQAFHCAIMAGYGLTETSPVATDARHKDTVCYTSEEDRLFHLSTAGWPILGNEIRVVDAGGADVPRDMQAAGEVVIRGDNVMDGYYKEPEATCKAIRDGWLHTGDMAVWDGENYIHIVDRKKDIIISGGENISSIEVEKAIFAHPAVLECAVVSAPDSKWGEIPAALVVLKPGQELSSDGLVEFLQSRLAKFKIPAIIQFVEGPLPKTGTGKILKRELRETFWAGKERRVQG
ncbi:MAG: long-chain-fatty-acid--CoA ligase [Acidobacteriaceae bacterium]|nr:long-chain-fatty-acid--CoA ligase [Acidobacteriaceae bacterium]